MKTLRVKMVGLLATALILFSAFRADKPVITIFMIGDSTMANKNNRKREPFYSIRMVPIWMLPVMWQKNWE